MKRLGLASLALLAAVRRDRPAQMDRRSAAQARTHISSFCARNSQAAAATLAALALALVQLGAPAAAETPGATAMRGSAPDTSDAIRVYWSNLHGIRYSETTVGNTRVRDPEPARWFRGDERTSGIAIDPAAGKIYFAGHDGSAIRVEDLGPGPAENLYPLGEEECAEGLAIDPGGGKIYWANGGSCDDVRVHNAIRVGNLDGSGSPATLFPREKVPIGVAVDPDQGRIYWTNFNGGEIRVGNLDGSGSPKTLFSGENHPAGIAIDSAAGEIYWANYGSGSIRVGNLDGSGSVSTVYVDTRPYGLAIDPTVTRVYWANRVGDRDGFVRVYERFQSRGWNLADRGLDRPTFVALLRAPIATGPPEASGSGDFFEPLSCSDGEWAADLVESFLYVAPHKFSYQWQRDGVDIQGATEATIPVGVPGKYTCQVTASNGAGATTSRKSAPVTLTKTVPTISAEASATVALGGSVHATATLAGLAFPTSARIGYGALIFSLYGPDDADCSGTAIFTDAKPLAGDGNGDYDSGRFIPTETGTYRWIAAYSGDDKHAAVSTTCGEGGALVAVTDTASPPMGLPDTATGGEEPAPQPSWPLMIASLVGLGAVLAGALVYRRRAALV